MGERKIMKHCGLSAMGWILTACACLMPSMTMTAAAQEDFVLAEDGKAAVSIVVDARGDADGAARRAADNLAFWLKEICGADFVVSEAATGARIVVGGKLPESVHVEGLTAESVGWVPVGEALYIVGPKPEEAVWHVLDMELGCRWYTPTCSRIPHTPNLRVKRRISLSRPALRRRLIHSSYDLCGSDSAWAVRNRLVNDPSFNHVPGWFCHTYANICPMAERESHPELFAQKPEGGIIPQQLCPTHPENLRRAVERVLETLRAGKSNSHSYIISITENDGGSGYCHCQRCMEIIGKHGDAPIAAHLTLVNHVAKAIANEFPHVKVEFLVYSQYYGRCPKDFTLEPNVILWFCNSSGFFEDLKLNQSVAEIPEAASFFDTWKSMVSQAAIWEYNCDYENYFRVMPTLPSRLKNLQFWAEHGAEGVMALEVFGTNGGDQQVMRGWIMGRMMWNPWQDPDALAREFCNGVYGKAAEPRYRYWKLVNDAGEAEKSIEEFYGAEAFHERAEALFQEAFRAAVGDAEATRQLEIDYMPIAISELDACFAQGKVTDLARYKELLKLVKTVTAREHMIKYNEHRAIEGRLAEYTLLENAANGGTLQIHSVNGLLYEYPVVDDPLSTTGRATRVPCNDNWLVQWPIPVPLCKKGTRYQLRAEVRMAVKTDTEYAATIGVHRPSNVQESITVPFSAAKLPYGQYGWIEVGQPFIPKDGDYVWFAAKTDSGIEWLYIDRIELVPVE